MNDRARLTQLHLDCDERYAALQAARAARNQALLAHDRAYLAYRDAEDRTNALENQVLLLEELTAATDDDDDARRHNIALVGDIYRAMAL